MNNFQSRFTKKNRVLNIIAVMILLILTQQIVNEHNIKQKGRPSPVINLYPERDELVHHTNNIVTGKLNVLQTLPGNSSFSNVTKYGKKTCVIGDSHFNRIKKNLFSNSLANRKTYLSVFCSSTIKRLNYFVAPTLVQDDVIIIHVRCNTLQNKKWTLLILINLQMILLILRNYVLIMLLGVLLCHQFY